jgi:O-antigen/teichoic acid export membrane protein
MSLVKRFFKDSALYALQPLVAKVVLFALIPVYTKYLSAADFGNLEYMLTVGAFFGTFIDLGLSSSFWNFKSGPQKQPEGLVVLNMLLSSLGIGLAILMLYILLWQGTGNAPALGGVIALLLLSEVFKKAYDMAMLLYTAAHKPWRFLIGGLVYAALLVTGNLFFVMHMGLKVEGVIWAYLGSGLLSALLWAPLLWQRSEGRFDFGLSKKMISYGFPIMLGNLVLVLMTLSSRFFLKEFTTDTALGQFAYVNKWGTLAQVLLANAFYIAWNPIRWEIYEMEEGPQLFQRFSQLFLTLFPALALLLTGGLFVFVPLVTYDSEYIAALNLLPFVVMSFVFFAIYYFNSMGLLFTQKTRVITYIMLVVGLANVLLNFWLISAYGTAGAAWGMFGSYLLLMLLGGWYSQKYYPIPRNKQGAGLQLLLLTLVAPFLYISLKGLSNYWWQAALCFGFAMCWILLAVLLKQLRRSDLAFVRAKLQRPTAATAK